MGRIDVRRIDWVLLAALCGIMLLGLLSVSHATGAQPGVPATWSTAARQAAFMLVALLVGLGVALVDPQLFAGYRRPLYVFNLILLLAVRVIGVESGGAERWIALGPLSFQPSEFAKLLLVVTLASLLSERAEQGLTWREFFLVGMYALIPMVLVLLQPDLGTSLVFIVITIAMLYMAGFSGRLLAGLAVAGLGAAAAVITLQMRFGLDFPLKQYQIRRLIVFTDPYRYAATGGYQIIQSEIAIGSGREWGYGLFNPSHATYVPAGHTDFIFANVGSQLGFAGGALLLALYALLMYRALRIAGRVEQSFASLLIVGVVAMLAFQVFVNIGMASGIMPVTGIPLPLMSVGGSAVATDIIGIALIEGVAIHQHETMFGAVRQTRSR